MTRLPDIGSAAAVSDGKAPVLVVPMGADREPGPGAEYVLDRLGSWVEEHLEGVGFSGKPGEVAVIPTGGGLRYNWVVMAGVGDDPDHETVRRASAIAYRAAPRTESLVTTLHQVSTPGALAATVEGSLLAGYRYDNYRSEPSDRPLAKVLLASPLPSDWADAAERGRIVAEAVANVRDWVNQTGLDQGPADLAASMSEVATDAGMTVEIWDEEKLEEEGMGGILSVGRGSHRPPCLVRLVGPGEGPKLTLVGKGITFDSGGLSLKTPGMMEAMKTDMAGAAAAAAAGAAISRLGLGVRLEVLAALAENMPGGRASRPGDVFRARNGKTVEVLNTDAEGRLVLSDALSLGAEGAPDLMVDLATLTGACKIALGLEYAGLFGTEDARRAVAGAAEAAGEKVWPLPLPPEYRKLLDSPVADMKNTGGQWGSAITAALVLKEFTADVPWAHLDVAGPARSAKKEHYISEGGTGFGVRTLVELASRMASEG
ncbi:MAG: leucyl aminopeptidase [bacterium]|nr:leucyl aminopeptidase [bacterium]MDE0601693.1 leucyl aminopeptidase [bacterium]